MRNSKAIELQRRKVNPHDLITSDTFQIMLSDYTLNNLAIELAKRERRPATSSDLEMVRNFVSRENPRYYFGKSYSDAISDMISRMLEIRREPVISDYEPDIKELTEDEHIYAYNAFADRVGKVGPGYKKAEHPMKMIADFLDPSNIDTLIKKSNSIRIDFDDISLKHHYIPINSRYRLGVFPDKTIYNFSWDLTTAAPTGSLVGTVKIQDNFTNIISIKTCRFWIPLSMAPANMLYYDRVRLFIKEISTQCALDHLNSYHFEYTLTVTGSRVYLDPIYDEFKLRYPLKSPITRLTIEFNTPEERLEFPPDLITATIAGGSPAIITTTTPNGLSTGDLVYVYNKPYIITVLDPVTFTVPIVTVVPGAIEVYIGARQIVTSFRFCCLDTAY